MNRLYAKIRLLVVVALFSITTLSSGCVALLDASFREAQDHGKHARYENKSFGQHFLDSLAEQDDDDENCSHHHHPPQH